MQIFQLVEQVDGVIEIHSSRHRGGKGGGWGVLEQR